MSYKISNALEYGVFELQALQRPRLQAELLLAFLLKTTRTYLHIHFDEEISDSLFCSYQALLERLKKNEPFEYITQQVSFYSYEWKITKGVLIPRPETEILVEKVDQLIKERGIKKIFELGIGSGVISIMLALLNPDLEIIASDINPLALKLAEENLCAFCKLDPTLQNRITLWNEDVLKNPQNFSLHSFDLLVSNPPYIASSFSLPLNVRYEPQEALFGGEGGEEILFALVDLAYQFCIPAMACEMGYDQKEKMQDKLSCFKQVEFYQDLSGLDRGFIVLE